MKNMPPFSDLYKLKEDDRIDLIGHCAMHKLMTVGFVLEDDAKAERYIAKLKAKFPQIVIHEKGPLKGLVMVKVGPPLHLN